MHRNRLIRMILLSTAILALICVTLLALNHRSKHTDPPWNLILVNRWHPIPKNYQVRLTKLQNDQAIDARVYPDLQAMMDDMRAASLSPLICSSYRTNSKQESLYQQKLDRVQAQGYRGKEAEEQAQLWVAPPGTSEHQLGLAVDIVDLQYQLLDEQQERTAVAQWLTANCWQYGFILRYPKEKSTITGVAYEPWHYRYVGKTAAMEMYASGLCLEEYLQKQQAEMADRP